VTACRQSLEISAYFTLFTGQIGMQILVNSIPVTLVLFKECIGFTSLCGINDLQYSLY
jgi:hypothetical protein